MRRSPLQRKTPLRSAGFLRRVVAKARRPRDTGPTPQTRLLVWERSGGACEWPDCAAMAVDIHHRLNRKQGGRKGDMAVLINGAAWLLAACRRHHEGVTSAHGPALAEARVMGWVLHEGEYAPSVPVLTRQGLMLHDDSGKAVLA